MQAHNVRLVEQGLERGHIGDAKIGRLRARERVIRNDIAAEAAREDPARNAPNLAGADDSDRLAVQVEPEQAVERKFPSRTRT